MKPNIPLTSPIQACGDVLNQVSSHVFGTEMSHLGVNFSLPTPEQASQIIAKVVRWKDSGEFLTPEETIGMGISQRRCLLLGACGPVSWKVMQSCLHCREKLDLELPLESIIAFQVAAEQSRQRLRFDWNQEVFVFRRPTGKDQRYWLYEGYLGLENSAARMISTLQVEGPPLVDASGDALEKLEGAFSDFDPLAAFSLNAVCPACGNENLFPFDLEAYVCRQLENRTERLLDEAHLFARHYHWPEETILALPSDRRKAYLNRILKDLNAY